MTSELYNEIIMESVNKVANTRGDTIGLCTLTKEQKEELKKVYRAYIENKKIIT